MRRKDDSRLACAHAAFFGSLVVMKALPAIVIALWLLSLRDTLGGLIVRGGRLGADDGTRHPLPL